VPEIWPVRPCADVVGVVAVMRRTATRLLNNQHVTGSSFCFGRILDLDRIPI